MITILNISDTKFSYNGIAYFKNFTPFVTGNKVNIVNTYDACISLTNFPTIYSDISVDGVTYGSVAALQNALLPVLFNRTFSQSGSLTVGYIPKATGINTLGNSAIYQDANGSVGIGISPPNYSTSTRRVLDINGTSQAMLALSVGGVGKGFLFHTGTDLLISNETNGSIGFNANGDRRVTILPSGNVGIRTTSPVSALTVGGSSGAVTTPTAITMDGTYRTGSLSFDSLKFYLYKSSTETYGFGLGNLGEVTYWAGTTSTGTHAFYTSQTERMRITSNGDVGIGVTSTSSYKLFVAGGQYGTYLRGGDLGTGSRALTVVKADNTDAFYVRGDGAVFATGTITATAFIPTSDIRLKDLIDYNYNVESIKPITYTWKDSEDKRKKIGYSAQQVQEFLPEVVNTDEKGMLSVDYNQIFVAKIDMLQNMIQELKAEIEILKN